MTGPGQDEEEDELGYSYCKEESCWNFAENFADYRLFHGYCEKHRPTSQKEKEEE